MLRFIAKSFLFIIIVITSVLFVIAAINPYLNLSFWLGAGFLGVLFPYLLLAELILFILCLILKPRWAIIIAIVLVSNWKAIDCVFPLNIFSSRFEIQKKDSNDIRVMTWNVRRFLPLSSNNLYQSVISENHILFLKKYKPDVVCLQEFVTHHNVKSKYNFIQSLQKLLKMPYYFFEEDYVFPDGFKSGNIIFLNTLL